MRIVKILGVAAAMAMGGTAAGQGVVTYAFTYQGSLTQSGAPASGAYDMEFRLFGAPVGSAQEGATICRDNVSVTEGLFTVALDFGAQFYGQQRYLEIRVRPGAGVNDCAASPGTYTLLTPRQALTAAPYALHSLSSDDWRRSAGNIFHSDGNVGIGTAAPLSRLHVAASVGGVAARFVGDSWNGVMVAGHDGAGVNDSAFLVLHDNSVGAHEAFFGLTGAGAAPAGALRMATNGQERMRITADGLVGLGTNTPTAPLHIKSGFGDCLTLEGLDHCYLAFYPDTVSQQTRRGWIGFGGADDNDLSIVNQIEGGNITMWPLGGYGVGIGTTPATGVKLDVAGVTRTHVLQITGGSDLAEPFDIVAAAGTPAQPGMVVVIDDASPGDLRVATAPYDRKVAGVISGANGLSPGMVMRAVNTPKADGEHPVALSGRVWVWCDASTGAITAGDRLTSSTTPGHAMRVADPARADGAVLGKAMTGLASGRGLVLMLVQPQ